MGSLEMRRHIGHAVVPRDRKYEVRIKQVHHGDFLGQVFSDGSYLQGGTFSGTRQQVIDKAAEFVEWHKNKGDEPDEVIEL